MRALLWFLFVSSAWAQAATVVAVTTVEGAGLASVLLAGVGSVNVLAGTKSEGACCNLFLLPS
jgi:sugar phosphate permease